MNKKEKEKFQKQRREKIKLYKPYVKEIWEVLGNLIRQSYLEKQIRFFVFDINPPTLHVGLFPCCGNKRKAPEELRIKFENLLLSETSFTNIIWEI